MNKNSQSNSCAHTSCACRVPAGQTYCGPHCANEAAQTRPEQIETTCTCGHGDCARDGHVADLT